MRRLFPLARVLSLVVLLFGLTMLVPACVSWGLHDGAESAFDEAILLTLSAGTLLWFMARGDKRELSIRDGFLMVALVWTVLPAFATLPLIIQLDASFTDAYFETVSGLTTTGATVLADLDKLPVSINVWRTQLIWLGGMGLIVLAVAILPLLGIGGRQMFKAETPGPMKESKLTPRLAQTAKWLWGVYGGITACCILSYRWAGMSWLDAVMHSFSTMGLGGFSSHDESFAYFNSPAIEAVSITFMLIAGMNFATHFMAVSGRSFRPYRNDPEVGWFLFVTLASVLGIAVFLRAPRSLSRFFRSTALFSIQRRFHSDDDGIFQHRLQPLADVCAVVDVVPVLLCDLCRVDRRRDQDGPCHRPLQAVQSGTGAGASPQRCLPGESRFGGRAWENPLCCTGIRLCVRVQHHLDDPVAFLVWSRNRYRLFGGRGQHQQYRSRT